MIPPVAFVVTCSNVPGTGLTTWPTHRTFTRVAATSIRATGFGNARLDYNLFRDAGRTQAWGNGTAAVSCLGDCAIGPGRATHAHNTHESSRVPAQQDAAAGTMPTRIVVTLTF